MLELKQTKDMYNTACKEALTAQNKVLKRNLGWRWCDYSVSFGLDFRTKVQAKIILAFHHRQRNLTIGKGQKK
jgi:hypothetical protein